MNNIPAEPLSHADYVRLLVKADAEIARLRVALKLALTVAESWTHDQLNGTSSFDSAWAELESARAALRGGEGV